MSRAFISVIESGKQGLSRNLLKKICSVFDVSADWLLGFQEEAPIQWEERVPARLARQGPGLRGVEGYLVDAAFVARSGGVREEPSEYVMRAPLARGTALPAGGGAAPLPRSKQESAAPIVLRAEADEELYDLVTALQALPANIRLATVRRWLAKVRRV